MTDQEILDNAPEGAHSFDMDNQYYDGYGNRLNKDGVWCQSDSGPAYPSSLADIKRIAELEKERDGLEEKTKSLLSLTMRMVDRWWPFVHGAVVKSETARKLLKEADDTINGNKKILEAHNLEQQAKGVKWVLACRELNLSKGEVYTMMDKCNQLRNQAKALKEQSE